MRSLSIFWGTQATSPVVKSVYRAALKDYTKTFGNSLILEQVHGTAGYVVDQDLAANWPANVPKGDYLITQVPKLSIGVLTADCLPIIFFDAKQKVAAIAHAGWRGTVAGIAKVVYNQLNQNFNVKPEDLQIFLGPSAKSCCYEVDLKFVTSLQHDKIATQCFLETAQRYFFDVSKYNMLCLQAYGVPVNNINLKNNICTICHNDYCSYRKYGDQTGLQLSLVTLY